MKFHPFSEIFPLLEGAAFEELVSDIKSYGLREKIWLYEGKILDGRNRFLACQKAKAEAEFREFKGTAKGALSHVISANVHRRHLTESQRAMAAAEIARMQHGGDRRSDQAANLPLETQAEAAKALNVSERSVRSARKVKDKGSKALQDAVKGGQVSVSKAAAVTELPKREQLAAATAEPGKAAPPSVTDPEWVPPDPDEDERLARFEKEYNESITKVMEADDKLAAAHLEIRRQASEIAVLKTSRDGFMMGRQAVIDLLKTEQRKVAALERKLKKTTEAA